jgi:hypothetical protein
MAAERQRAAASARPKTVDTDTPLDLTRDPAVREIVGGALMDATVAAFKQMEWAEDEIETAVREHPDHADRVWHSFALLTPTHALMSTEMVYRAHCREILARVVAGEDTRPGTAAECCCACCETSQVAPLSPAGFGLYLRMWKAAGFPEIDTRGENYVAITGDAIDAHEQSIRKKLAVDSRQLPDVLEHVRRCPTTDARRHTDRPLNRHPKSDGLLPGRRANRIRGE